MNFAKGQLMTLDIARNWTLKIIFWKYLIEYHASLNSLLIATDKGHCNSFSQLV